ncbi:NADH-ubiquinone oxidoreductase-F iron-sulfur binding region domain-containing protein [Kutzneria sp. CA-103260]|uniref:NADH-ubiquinone oxidoreductase-F iron-sulfur binding region domain-containing protein n=1 Tax=Kutzneria sp. CA-103260 TaxID=2802641 RepID=UPI001BADD027|nr:NADH-ubiquinone oxidoreductase-F iron-sulfur binding region domain-containing protein [Kutzneria sp. CA-103260]QUQ67827.1 respiratory-chain NADH dehydrogenase-related protein [Kutzneria sp. CA-103260]
MRPLLDAAARSEDEHIARNGPLPWPSIRGALIGAVQEAGLTGRGGANFPTWRKLARTAVTDHPVVIANAAEGEPASRKDKVLLEHCPHLVLDGLQLAADAVGADRVYLYGPKGIVVPKRKSDRHPIVHVTAPDAFTAGESSAVMAAVAGRPAKPTDRGRDDMLVQNVETLARIAQIARCGPRWFRQHDTYLATISGAVRRPGVYEVARGATVQQLLDLAGESEPVKAVLVGGYHGTWLRPHDTIADPGAGVAIALPAKESGLARTTEIVRYLAVQSVKQCGPCRFGLPALAEAMTRHQWPQVNQLVGLVDGRGACHHPDGTARLVRSAMAAFEGEWR